jgi:hypothetical protein
MDSQILALMHKNLILSFLWMFKYCKAWLLGVSSDWFHCLVNKCKEGKFLPHLHLKFMKQKTD